MFQKIKAWFLKVRIRLTRADVHDINGPETLPEPVSKAQEEALLKRLAAGERKCGKI